MQSDTSSAVSWFLEQFRYVSFVFFDTSSSVSWLSSQYRDVSSVKCSMPVRSDMDSL